MSPRPNHHHPVAFMAATEPLVIEIVAWVRELDRTGRGFHGFPLGLANRVPAAGSLKAGRMGRNPFADPEDISGVFGWV